MGKSSKASANYRYAVNCTRASILILCIFGILLSCYAYYVKIRKEKDSSYQAMCDISEHMSCTAVLSSSYSKGFGLLDKVTGKDSIFYQSNSVFGIIFYSVFAILGFSWNPQVIKLCVILAVLSNLSSVYLAYILYFILYDFCVVCVSTYVVNFGLLMCSLYRYKLMVRGKTKKNV